MYVPFWLFDADADAQVRYRATKVQNWSNSSYNYEEKRYYLVRRGGSVGFEDVPVEEPYYIGYSEDSDPLYWYADKWYRCNACGTLWEFRYPDFPAVGRVRKFEDGIYPGPETNL